MFVKFWWGCGVKYGVLVFIKSCFIGISGMVFCSLWVLWKFIVLDRLSSYLVFIYVWVIVVFDEK